MNNTDKATLDVAKRMLRGKIAVEEVSAMLGISVATLMPIKEEMEEEVRKVYGNTDAYDFDMNKILFDDFNDTGLDLDIPDEEK
ncbi:MAG: hypothetical protein IJD40_09790 [Lachnospiraceae bacterium]|nr:hypothetical protein [Lachnospiraceae bacterium]